MNDIVMRDTDGGALVVRTLSNAGVQHIFTLHGGHLDPIFQACLDADIQLLDTRHEAAAGHAADAYARQTGKLGVAVVTAGPGFTNVLTAMAQAFLDRIPVLFLSGAAPLRDVEALPLQGGIDQVAMARPVCKWAAQVTRTESIPHVLKHAMRIALAGAPGPVFVEVPIDVLFNRIDDTLTAAPLDVQRAQHGQTKQTANRGEPDREAIDAVLDLLDRAQRPVLMAGGGVLLSRAGAELRRFAEQLQIPVFCNSKALGSVPFGHPQWGGGFANLFALQGAMHEPDVALVLGARFGMFTRGGKALPATCKVIQVDIDAAELGRNRHVDLALNADCYATLRALNDVLEAVGPLAEPDSSAGDARTVWCGQVQQLAAAHRRVYGHAKDGSGAHPYRVVDAVMEALPTGTIVCADGGESSQWAELLARPNAGGELMSHGYLGCLGIGLPYAIGAQVANPDKRVVVIVGDGALGINVQEFDTMVRHQLPIVVVVLNNRAWGMCVHGQESMYGSNRLVVTKLGDGRYDQVAAGFGCHAEFVKVSADVGEAVRRALASGKPACVNVLTDLAVAFGAPPAETPDQERRASAANPADSVAMPYYEKLELK